MLQRFRMLSRKKWIVGQSKSLCQSELLSLDDSQHMLSLNIQRQTVAAREELAKEAAKVAEETRVQLRRIQQSSIKKGGYAKHSVEIDEVRSVSDSS